MAHFTMMPSALWLPFVFAAANHIAVSGFYHLPASLVPHPSAYSIKNGKEMHNIMGSTAARGTPAGTTSSKDAEAYNDIVSAAVDFTSIYFRNGIVTGEDHIDFCFLSFPPKQCFGVDIAFPHLPQRRDPPGTSIRTLDDSSFTTPPSFHRADVRSTLRSSCHRK